MFREKTVFILGAGASWHYSCPTGEELVKLVSQKAQELRTFLLGPARIAHVPQLVSDRFSNLFVSDPAYSSVWRDVARECLDISDRLARSNPPVIDYFLAHNPDLRDIGRFLIAWAILECEAKHGHGRWNRNRGPQYSENYRDNWYRYLLSKLMSECPTANALRENRITFVTFNYDVSLELQIYDGLTATSFFNNEPKCIDNFFGDGRFLHVYGSVRDCPPTKLEEADLLLRSQEVLGGQDGQWINQKKLLDAVYKASKRISTIETIDKATNQKVIDSAKLAIDKARRVYLLGYGFDRQNSERLGLDMALYRRNSNGKHRAKSIMFTNFHDSNQVNKRASRLFFRTANDLLPNQPAVHGFPEKGFYVEKSIRDTYGALEFDFDL
jgi:hypothetical protein